MNLLDSTKVNLTNRTENDGKEKESNKEENI